eukprot:501055_1
MTSPTKFGSVAAGKVAYLKQLKYQDWHGKRIAAHIRSNIYGTNEYCEFDPSNRSGRKELTSRLKGPIVEHFYADNDDRVLYAMTRNRKAHMHSMTSYEQQTLFHYRRRKNLYWKSKIKIQIGKKRMPDTLNCHAFPAAYKYNPPRKIAKLKRKLAEKNNSQTDS